MSKSAQHAIRSIPVSNAFSILAVASLLSKSVSAKHQQQQQQQTTNRLFQETVVHPPGWVRSLLFFMNDFFGKEIT